MINRVILVGNLTRDAETLATAGKPMTKMRLATNHQWKAADGNRQEAAEFHSVVAFGRLAEVCALYCSKGRPVYLEGRLRTREYAGADGLRRFSTEIVAETMKLLPSRDHASGADAAEDLTADGAIPVDDAAIIDGLEASAGPEPHLVA
jgi:single-strand DNA-binding protein